jgi:hypothetical protein
MPIENSIGRILKMPPIALETPGIPSTNPFL